MDIKIIFALILGIYQALDTKNALSNKTKDILSIILIIYGSLPIFVQLLVWIFGHGPKVQPILDGLLKILTMGYYEQVNTYLYLRNKGIYCSEVKRKGGFYKERVKRLMEPIEGSSEVFNYSKVMKYKFPAEKLIDYPKKGLEHIHFLSHNDSLECDEYTIEQLLFGLTFSGNFEIGPLNVVINGQKISKTSGENALWNIDIKKEYSGSTQSKKETIQVNQSTLAKWLFIQIDRKDMEVISTVSESKFRRTTIAHSLSILDCFESLKYLTDFSYFECEINAYIEGLLVSLEHEGLIELLKGLNKNLSKTLTNYFDIMNFNDLQRCSVVKWLVRDQKSCVDTRLEGHKNWGTKRLMVDLQAIFLHQGIKSRIFHDNKIKPRSKLLKLLTIENNERIKNKANLKLVEENIDKLLEVPNPPNITLNPTAKHYEYKMRMIERYRELPLEIRLKKEEEKKVKLIKEKESIEKKNKVVMNYKRVLTESNNELTVKKYTQDLKRYTPISPKIQDKNELEQQIKEKIFKYNYFQSEIKEFMNKPINEIKLKRKTMDYLNNLKKLKVHKDISNELKKIDKNFTKETHIVFDVNKSIKKNQARLIDMGNRIQCSVEARNKESWSNYYKLLSKSEFKPNNYSLKQNEVKEVIETIKDDKGDLPLNTMNIKAIKHTVYKSLTLNGFSGHLNNNLKSQFLKIFKKEGKKKVNKSQKNYQNFFKGKNIKGFKLIKLSQYNKLIAQYKNLSEKEKIEFLETNITNLSNKIINKYKLSEEQKMEIINNKDFCEEIEIFKKNLNIKMKLKKSDFIKSLKQFITNKRKSEPLSLKIYEPLVKKKLSILNGSAVIQENTDFAERENKKKRERERERRQMEIEENRRKEILRELQAKELVNLKMKKEEEEKEKKIREEIERKRKWKEMNDKLGKRINYLELIKKHCPDTFFLLKGEYYKGGHLLKEPKEEEKLNSISIEYWEQHIVRERRAGRITYNV